MEKIFIAIFTLLFIFTLGSRTSFSQVHTKENQDSINKKVFENQSFHSVKEYPEPSGKRPKNVIFLIGDGMGLSQIFGGLSANKGRLFLQNFTHIGFSTTHSHSHFTTDSGAAGTALATGKKTYNGAIGVGPDSCAVINIRERAAQKGLATGVVSTSAVTHATPASFVAHQKGRSSYEKIAEDFTKADIDLFIGGGLKHFSSRKDGRNLVDSLKIKGFQILTDWKQLDGIERGKVAGLLAPEHLPTMLEERGEMLPTATRTAIKVLNNNKKGFFLMVEGSQIDWGGHDNHTGYIVSEVLDFDKAVGVALEFASINKETLVLVTADHETGGFAITEGNYKTGKVSAGFVSKDHSSVMVPVFAFGPGADQFRGFFDNTDIPIKIKELLKLP